MNKPIALVAIAIIAYLVFGRADTLESGILKVQNRGEFDVATATVGGNCYQERCLTIYVAPWCPACQKAKKTIVSLTKELQKEGVDVKVIVGTDSPEATVKYAKGYPFPVYLDADSSFYKKADQPGVPFYLVTDKNGKITNSEIGGYLNVKVMREKLEI